MAGHNGFVLPLLFCVMFINGSSGWICARQPESADVQFLTGQWQPHDMREIEKNCFEVIGNDPFVSSWDLLDTTAEMKGFIFQLSLTPTTREHRLQCYWETESEPFKEVNSFKFVLEKDKKEYQVFIPTYFFDTRQRIRRIRLDVDPETDRRLKIISMGIIKKVRPALLAHIPKGAGCPQAKDFSVFDTPVVARHQESLSVANERVLLHDIQSKEDKKLHISGRDPYIEFPSLDLDVHQARGIYLKIFSEGKNESCKMQFFWKSYLLDYNVERKPFNEEDSYRFWAKFNNGIAEFYLPFYVLDPKDLLKAVRLDFDSCHNMTFTIQQATIINHNDNMMKKYIPHQITYKNMAAIPLRDNNGNLEVNWYDMLLRDKSFWIVYILLLGLIMLAISYFMFVNKSCRDCKERC